MSNLEKGYYEGLTQIRKVDEVEAVNGGLNAGWVILKIGEESVTTVEGGTHIRPIFIMGQRTPIPATVPKESKPPEPAKLLCKYGCGTEIRIESSTRKDGSRGWSVFKAGTNDFHNCPNRPKR